MHYSYDKLPTLDLIRGQSFSGSHTSGRDKKVVHATSYNQFLTQKLCSQPINFRKPNILRRDKKWPCHLFILDNYDCTSTTTKDQTRSESFSLSNFFET